MIMAAKNSKPVSAMKPMPPMKGMPGAKAGKEAKAMPHVHKPKKGK
jgi:hypothetical protein